MSDDPNSWTFPYRDRCSKKAVINRAFDRGRIKHRMKNNDIHAARSDPARVGIEFLLKLIVRVEKHADMVEMVEQLMSSIHPHQP